MTQPRVFDLVYPPRLISLFGLSGSAQQVTGGAPWAFTGLSPFQTVIWFLSIGSAGKQIFWKFVVAKEPIYAGTALIIAILNTILNSLNTLAYIFSALNPTYFPPWSIYIGTVLYLTGILTETISELQRKSFKNNPKNEGKIYTGGLFSVARHISYTGYSLWRGGFALAAGGPFWGLFVFLCFLRDFGTRAIPVVDAYMSKTYGQQWVQVKQKIPYALLPGIW